MILNAVILCVLLLGVVWLWPQPILQPQIREFIRDLEDQAFRRFVISLRGDCRNECKCDLCIAKSNQSRWHP